MVDVYSLVLQSPSYDGTGGNGEQLPLPGFATRYEGASLADVISLFGSETEGEGPENYALDLGKFKEAVQIQGRFTEQNAELSRVRADGAKYQTPYAMRDALRRARIDWPQETASGDWGSSGLPAEEQDPSTDRRDDRVRLIFDMHDQDNDGDFGYLMMYGFVQQYQAPLVAPAEDVVIPFNLIFVPTKVVAVAPTTTEDPAGGSSGVIDSFEDGDTTEYTVHTANQANGDGTGVTKFKVKDEVDVSTAARDGSLLVAVDSEGGTEMAAVSTSGLSAYPAQGDFFRADVRTMSDPDPPQMQNKLMMFGVPSESSVKGYGVGVHQRKGEARLWRFDGGGSSTSRFDRTLLDSQSFNVKDGTWYIVEVEWKTDGTIRATLYEQDGAGGGDVVADLFAVDTTYSATGIGWFRQTAGGSHISPETYADFYRFVEEQTAEKIIDDFEDGDISEYGVTGASDTGAFTTVQSGPFGGPFNGSWALETDLDGTGAELASTSGLARYPSQGDSFSFRLQFGDNASARLFAMFGIQDQDNWYQVKVDRANEELALFVQDNGSRSTLGTDSTGLISDVEWLRVKVDWGSSSDFTVTLFDADGSELGQLAATDTTFTSGGFGWAKTSAVDEGVKAWFDFARIL